MVGFIGLGIMGKPMVKNLLSAKYDVLVYDIVRDAARTLETAGAVAADISEIGDRCDVIFLSLPSGSIVQSVLFGEDNLSSYLHKGTVIADTSSITPAESRFCFSKLSKTGIGYVDCPVSGGEAGAVNGTLAFMVGGLQRDFVKLKPYFQALGNSAIWIGKSGSGSIAKLANQVIVNVTIAAVSEALVLIEILVREGVPINATEVMSVRQALDVCDAISPEEYEDFGPVVKFRTMFEDSWESARNAIAGYRS